MTRRIPASCAASTLARSPPIGRTVPCSESSPVIAVSVRGLTPVSHDTSATAMAMPADGPSFGAAPDGACTWNTCVCRTFRLAGKRRRAAFARTHEKTMFTLSCITLPRLPVMCSWSSSPRSDDDTSTTITLPPAAVHASPTAKPGWFSRLSRNLSVSAKVGSPRMATTASRFSGMVNDRPPRTFCLACTCCATAARHSDAMRRSSPRTPASTVNCDTKKCRASSDTEKAASSTNPCLARCRGTR
mmetsp:Transcript_16625/g.51996  ORF Transcript_16625/g.51996 Transcript_16625/m.51996 type:complete len:245 (-) Transcript_16625:1691-2425(-)